jgi:hypothetical protein
LHEIRDQGVEAGHNTRQHAEKLWHDMAAIIERIAPSRSRQH